MAKPDGSVHLCVDYRAPNALTVVDPNQMPLIEQVLDILARAKVLSKLDLKKGFHQVPSAAEDCYKRAFVFSWGKFEYHHMPFGVRNRPAIFQRLSDLVLAYCLDFSRVYIDYIVVYL